MADIYGPGKLLRTGDLPPEIVFANPAFVRAAHGLQPPGGIYLQTYAVDVARSPDGRWWVVGDRTDTPAGAGYALENRIVLSRVYPELIRDCRVQRLARFFQQLRDGLLERAAVRNRDPRVVIYTPGPFHSTYFEQAYLARYLGFNLVEGRDLTVRDQGVFLKTLSGLLPVDVILRRVNSDYCDPLELRGDSLLGVPGLLQVARAGNVVIANAIGTGVVETPALLPFLPTLCRRLLGRRVVVAAGGHLVVRPGEGARDGRRAARSPGREACLCESRVAGFLARTGAQGRDGRSAARQSAFVPGPGMRRAFDRSDLAGSASRAAASDGPAVCVRSERGRIRRDARRSDPRRGFVRVDAFERQDGGGSKDTWVLSHSTPDTTTLLPTHKQTSDLSRAGFILPSRLADDLYWLGRYVERIEFGCRLARCLLHRITNESELGHPDELVYLVDLVGHAGPTAGEFGRPRRAAARSGAGAGDFRRREHRQHRRRHREDASHCLGSSRPACRSTPGGF